MRNMDSFQGWRLTFFQGVLFAVFAIFAIRMYDLQVVREEDFQAAADENRLSILPISADRGVIYDRYNNLLASNAPAYIVEITPAELPSVTADRYRIYEKISALTGVPPTYANEQQGTLFVRSIERIVAEWEGVAPFRPVAVATDIDRDDAMRLLEDRISTPGVNVRAVAVREYPTGELTSHIVGYMGPVSAEVADELRELGFDPRFERQGYAGVEAYMESLLAGTRGSITREIDVVGEVQRELSVVPATAGNSLRLTIDTELQRAAEKALRTRLDILNQESQDAGQGIKTQRGVVIGMNPQTGEILAMVSYPSYDNRRFARAIDGEYYLTVLNDPLTPLLNKAVGSLYPPGSAWKLITASAVLQENVIEPSTTLFDPGDLFVENRYAPNDPAQRQRFVCHFREGHGNVNIVGAIAQSCNVYFYQVGGGNPAVSPMRLREGGLGINNLVRYAQALGIGTELGIELYGELAGRMPDPDWKRVNQGENWSTGDTYNAAFGQGYITVTPLQMISSVQAIITGKMLQPTLIREILDEAGNPIRPFEPIVARTLNLSEPNPDGTLTLFLQEDMIMKGKDSLACTCEPDSPFYNAVRCNPDLYRSSVDVDPAPFVDDFRSYQVHVPFGYAFNGRVCDSLRFDPDYIPAFFEEENLNYVRLGMREAVVVGTSQGANLDYVAVAGKTGTAEYCDDIAFALDQCEFGNWPDHAWFTAYAPYEAPEILLIAFIYNGEEGSRNALPVVKETMEEYFRLKTQRGEGGPFNPSQPES
jgi:penicillin-binding protein 2